MASDAQIERDLQLRLFRLGLPEKISIHVSNGVASLSGSVSSFRDKIAVERAVLEDRRIRGARNGLRVITETPVIERWTAG